MNDTEGGGGYLKEGSVQSIDLQDVFSINVTHYVKLINTAEHISWSLLKIFGLPSIGVTYCERCLNLSMTTANQ